MREWRAALQQLRLTTQTPPHSGDCQQISDATQCGFSHPPATKDVHRANFDRRRISGVTCSRLVYDPDQSLTHFHSVSSIVAICSCETLPPSHNGCQCTITVPAAPSTVIRIPSVIRLVAFLTPSTHGIPSSRLTIAA